MKQVQTIEHEGVIESVDARAGIVVVRLEKGHDCGGCQAAKICGAIGGKNADLLTIPTRIAGAYNVGENVRVSGTEAMHHKAIMLATVLPCLTLIVAMVAVYLLTHSQLSACLAGLGAMTAFFVALWLLRNKIAREFVFSIKKIPRE